MNEQELELELVEKGLNAPRINPDKIDAMIKDALYYVFPGTTLTVCCLRLVNGFTVTGESACVNPPNRTSVPVSSSLTSQQSNQNYLESAEFKELREADPRLAKAYRDWETDRKAHV